MTQKYYLQILGHCVNRDIPMDLAKLIACQSAFETNNFTSNNFLKSNNGFGYKHVNNAKLQLPNVKVHSTESDFYANYATFSDSIEEVIQWIFRRQKEKKFPSDLSTIETTEQYARLLKNCGYYGGKFEDYSNGMNMYFKSILS